MTQMNWSQAVRLGALLLVAGAGLTWAWAAEDDQQDKSKAKPAAKEQVADGVQQAADVQPAASQPAKRESTLRKPEQAQILEHLLGQKDVVPLQPRSAPGQRPESGGANGPGAERLLLEGTLLVERPGRYVEEGGRAVFICRVHAEDAAPRKMPILENQLLETMEREAEAGFSEFIVSAEITRYRGKNYLLLKKVLRRASHGNLSP
jgi:hypothetical protein